MRRALLFPVVGTLAAAIAIAFGHGEKEGSPYPIKELVPPPPKKKPPDKPPAKKKPKPAPVATKYLLEVMENGSYQVHAITQERKVSKEPLDLPSLDAFLDHAAPEGGPRPLVHVFATSSKVTDAQLEEAAGKLRTRCDVVIQSREEKEKDSQAPADPENQEREEK